MSVAATWPEPDDHGPPPASATATVDSAIVLDPPAPDLDAGAADRSSGDGQPTVVPEKTAPPRTGGHLPHFPAIEGLRGLAVAGVLLFHAGFSWMQGGYLGVSTFFTLSGFLITSLLLAERAATGGVDLRRFWVRRVRRLMPAAMAALAFIAVFGIVAADAAQKRNLAGDVTAALLYVANWRFLFSGQSYGDLFSAPSPVLHFWSLAIEEQFYLLFPLIAWVGLKKLRLGRLAFAAVLAVLAAGSLALTLLGGLSQDAIYYSTFTRAFELLAGGLLAALVYHRRVTTVLVRHRGVRVLVALGGATALVAVVVLWITTPQSTEWLYRGGFAGYSVLSAIVIVAAIAPYGLVHHVLAVRPLRWLGGISYGVYLFHWPVFLWLSSTRTGISEPLLFPIQVAVTLAIAVVSLRFLETPIRRGERLGRVRPVAIAPFAAVAIVVAVVAVTVSAPKPLIDFESAQDQLNGIAATPGSGPVDTSAAAAPFPRVAIFGDSTALMTGLGLNEWAKQTHQAEFVPGDAKLGCGISRGGLRVTRDNNGHDELKPIEDLCNRWERNWKQKIVDNEPTVAVVQVGPWEVADRVLPGETTVRHLGDPVYDSHLAGELDLAVRTLSADGAIVVFLTSPLIGPNEGVDPITARGDAAQPARMLRLNELISALPAKFPGQVQVVDLASWIASTGEDARLRPDGVHFGSDDGKHPELNTSLEVANRFLGNAIVKAYKDGWEQRRSLPTSPTSAATTDTTDPAPSYDHKRKVVVMGDETAMPLADALTDQGQRTGAIDVVKAISPGCGFVPTAAHKVDGVTQATPPQCAGATFGRLQITAAAKPDLILVVPSRYDFLDLQVPFTNNFTSWTDDAFTKAAEAQFGDLTKTLNRVHAAVIWLDTTTIRTGDRAPDPARLERYVTMINGMLPFIGYSHNMQVSNVDKYIGDRKAEGHEVFDDNGAIAVDQNAPFAEWLTNDLLSRYDEWVAGGMRDGAPK